MNKKISIHLLYSIATLSLLLFMGCGNNNTSPLGGCGGEWVLGFEDEANALSETSANYRENPTVENCEIHKSAFQDYYQALREISTSCIPGTSEQAYQEMLAKAQSSIDEIDCSESEGN